MRKTSRRRRRRGAARRRKEGEGGRGGVPVDGEGQWRGRRMERDWGRRGPAARGRMHCNTEVRSSDLVKGAGK